MNKDTHQLAVRVYYEDTDSGGVVYHSNYLKYMERARTEWLRHLQLEQADLVESLSVVFVVHSVQIAFKKPARLDELLEVSTQIKQLGRSSIVFLQKIFRNSQLLIEAEVKVACVDALSFKPVVIPKSVLLKMESI